MGDYMVIVVFFLSRKIRLNEVRLLFNTCYSATIMETPRDDGTFSARLGSLAERVGLTTPKTI